MSPARYASYWVYQHLGNLSPEQLDTDEVYDRMLTVTDDDERTRYLDDVAWQADVDATSIRWSFYRDLGGTGRGVRLVAIDSPVLTPARPGRPAHGRRRRVGVDP